jgi:hypothetical protein
MKDLNVTVRDVVRSPGNTYYSASSNTWTSGPPTIYATGVLLSNVQQNSSSVNTPGFRNKRRSLLPDNPYSMGRGRIDYPIMTLNLFQEFGNGDINQDKFIGPSIHFGANAEDTVPWNDSSYARAVTKVFGDLTLSKGSLAVTAAEFPKTAEHIANTATRLYKAYRALRRGALGDFTSSLGITASSKQIKRFNRRKVKYLKVDGNLKNFASSTWLEYTYGWKPLISDIYSQCENLAEYLTEHQMVVRTARKSAESERDFTLNLSPAGFPGKVTKRISQRRKTIVTIRYKLDGQPNLLNQFGITNPLEVVWELVPFSFVVDWILPVGNFIQSLTATNGLIFAGGTVSVRDLISIWSVVTADGLQHGTNPKTTWSGNGEAENEKVLKSRTVLTTFPSIQLPSLKDPSSFSHLASAIALLQSVFGHR